MNNLKSKVFGIGMFRTGTTSLGTALKILGYKVLDGPWKILKDSNGIWDNWWNDPNNWTNYHDHIINKVKQYNGFEDAPWMFIYQEVDKWFPNSKFILTKRINSDILAESEYRLRKRMGIKPKFDQDKFKWRYEKQMKEVRKYFKNRNNYIELCWETGDGWKELCNFLNKPIPTRKFPHLNRG